MNLDQFSELEELYLQNNKIKHLPNLHLKNLRKLDLSDNNIFTLENISNFKNLQFLFLENNNIENLNLKELILLNKLIELNISGNKIDSLKDCINLRKIESILNLDLSANEVCNITDFRLFIINYISNIKILNRIPVEKNEIQTAKEYFDGRVTSELLETRLGHYHTKNVIELDLSNNKLKSFENIFNSENFPILKKLDLSKNLFSSFKILGNLFSLNILIINSNLISSIIDSKEKQLSIKGILGIPVN